MNVRSVNKRPSRPVAARRRGRPLVDDKRRRILDAALETFADRGYHGTAVPEVAQAAGVGTGTLYRYFENKQALVNEVYRDAKTRLRATLLEGVPPVDLYKLDMAERWFSELWRRLAVFARAEPNAFRFLEMQDHAPYLDSESRKLELSLLAPLWLAGKRLREHSEGPPVDVLIALLWGAFVGLVKASRLGYLRLDDRMLEQAGAAAWRLIAPIPSRAATPSHEAAPPHAATPSRVAPRRSPRSPTIAVPRGTSGRNEHEPSPSRAAVPRGTSEKIQARSSRAAVPRGTSGNNELSASRGAVPRGTSSTLSPARSRAAARSTRKKG
jgi:AcrR family transcriptional regulator